MQIQTNTDSNITGSDSLTAQAKTVVEGALARFSDQITRVEIHLSDENGPRGGADDIRCLMEARLEGRQPVAVTHQAATVEQALDGAADKLKRSIERYARASPRRSVVCAELTDRIVGPIHEFGLSK